MSTPAKYHSYIPPVTLTRGSYILAISPFTAFEFDAADMIKFELDFLYEAEEDKSFLEQVLYSSLALCRVASPPKFMNSPPNIFIHYRLRSLDRIERETSISNSRREL